MPRFCGSAAECLTVLAVCYIDRGCGLLNLAARYFPILRELAKYTKGGNSVLEIGSGSLGLGEFYGFSFVGCDTSFAEPRRPPMLPVMGSGLLLPFADRSFDLVVASDVLEHVPPADRLGFIVESLRVMRRAAIFGYPCGPLAFSLDRQLLARYQKLQGNPPKWLMEHALHPFPDDSLFKGLPHRWLVRSFGNENLGFHGWMMRREMTSTWNRVFCALLEHASAFVEWALALADREPYYRRIFVVTCNQDSAGGEGLCTA